MAIPLDENGEPIAPVQAVPNTGAQVMPFPVYPIDVNAMQIRLMLTLLCGQALPVDQTRATAQLITQLYMRLEESEREPGNG